MPGTPIGEAFVRIRPDFSVFAAQVRAGATGAAATAGAGAAGAGAGAAAAQARVTQAAATAHLQNAGAIDVEAASLGVLTEAEAAHLAAQTALLRSQLAEEAAAAALAAAETSLAEAQAAAAAATAAHGAASKEALAAQAALVEVTNALAIAQRRLAISQGASALAFNRFARTAPAGAAGLSAFLDQSNALRGALIGISRITPVAVFGLGVIGTAAIAGGLAISSAVKSAAQLEQTLNVFQATTQATGEQMTEVSQVARELGRDVRLPGVSAVDAAVGMTQLARAGLTVRDSIAAARGVLQLATAAEIDAGEAANLTASALNAFDLAGDQASHVADLLAASSLAAQGEITDMGLALSQAAAVANQANIPIEDTVTAITELAKNGLIGSDAGTSLRTTILRLVPTTKEAATFQRALGVETQNAAGELLDLSTIAENYRVALQDLSETQQQAVLQQIFGQDAIRAASILFGEGAAGFQATAEQVEREGAAAEVAAAKSRGLSGSMRALSSNAETLGTTIGTSLIPGLKAFVDSINFGVSGLNFLIDGFKGGASEAETLTSQVEQLRREIELLGRTPARTKQVEETFAKIAARVADLQKQIERARGTGGEEDLVARLRAQLEPLLRLLGGQVGAAEATIEAIRAARSREAARPRLQELEPSVRGILTQEDLTRRFEQQRRLIEGQIRLIHNLGSEAFTAEGESFRVALENQIDSLLQLGRVGADQLRGVTDASQRARIQTLQAIARESLPILTQDLRISVQTIVPDLEISTAIPDEIQKKIERISLLPGGRARLEKLGSDMAAAIASGIDQSDDMVKAAERALDDAIEHMNEAIRDATRQARGNLESLGSSLAEQVDQIIDAMPFGIPRTQRQVVRIELQAEVTQATQALRAARESGLSGDALQPFIDSVNLAKKAVSDFSKSGVADIDTMNEALENLQAQLERRRLDFSLRQAQRAFRDARDEIASVTSLQGVTQTPGQSRAVQEILDPFREGVAEAEGARKVFNLEQTIKQMEQTRTQAKKTAREGIEKLVQDFEHGRISADAFRDALKDRLGPQLETLKSRFGKNLGLEFTLGFTRTLDAIVRQAQLLTGFLSVLGTEPGPDVTDVGKVARQERERVKQARINLENSLKDQKRTADNTTAQVRLLAFILATLKDPTPKDKKITPADVRARFREAQTMVDVAVDKG